MTRDARLFEYLDVQITRQAVQYDRALRELTDEQWHFIPDGKGNSIAFIAWHYFRTEDNIIHWIFQNRHPTVWMQGGWAERLGLPPVTQGTGMSLEDAHALRIKDIAGFLEYIDRVRAATRAFLQSWDQPDYDTVIMLKPVGEMTKLQLLGRQAFPHGFSHLGEIQHLRTMQDLPGIGL